MKNIRQWIILHQNKICVFLVAIAISVLLFYIAQNRQLKKDYTEREVTYNQQIVQYKLKDGTSASTINILKADKEQLQDIISSGDEKIKQLSKQFSKVVYVDRQTTEMIYDTLYVPYEKYVDYAFERSGKIGDGTYSAKYNSNEKGISLIDLKVYDTIVKIKGEKRKWFLGKKTYTIDETHSNPHIVITGAQSFELKEKKRWYETRIVSLIFGFAIGVATTNQ